jgi:putative glutamine amidotransferase
VVNARTTPTAGAAMDGLLLTGGGDISARFLHQEVGNPSLILDADSARDAWEFDAVARAVGEDKPALTICRGLQVLNVALGGALHLDVPGHADARERDVQPLRYLQPASRRFAAVNSSHHQALARVAPGLEVLAVCALDGVIEQAWMPGRRFVVGTQFHPERGTAYAGLFADFFGAVSGEERPAGAPERAAPPGR